MSSMDASKDGDVLRDLLSVTRTFKIFGGLISVACVGVVTWNLNLSTKVAAVERENAIQAPRIERIDGAISEFRRELIEDSRMNALQAEQISVLKSEMIRFGEKLDRALERITATPPK